jgi:O-antigen ligase
MPGIFGPWARRITVAAIVVAGCLLPLTASRLAAIALAMSLLAYGLLSIRARSGQRFALAAGALALPVVLLALRFSPDLAAKLSSVAVTSGPGGTSTSLRRNLILNGWDFFTATRGTGTGAAGYESLILAGEFRHPLYDRVVNPHNMWIEILSEYGIVGFCSVGLMIALAILAVTPLRHPSSFGAAYVAALVAYVIAAMTASSYVNDAVSWTFFATFVALGVGSRRIRQHTAP